MTPKPSARLSDIKNGTVATIKKIDTADSVVRNRLFSMGLVEGREISVSRRSPFGGTICIELIGLGSSLALRLSEAEAVSIMV